MATSTASTVATSSLAIPPDVTLPAGAAKISAQAVKGSGCVHCCAGCLCCDCPRCVLCTVGCCTLTACLAVCVPMLQGEVVPSRYTSQTYCGECLHNYCTIACYDCNEVYCEDCFRTTHTKGYRVEHQRVVVLPKAAMFASGQKCGECDESEATYFCGDCTELYCLPCVIKVHRKGYRVLHSEIIQIGESKGVGREAGKKSMLKDIVSLQNTLLKIRKRRPMFGDAEHPYETVDGVAFDRDAILNEIHQTRRQAQTPMQILEEERQRQLDSDRDATGANT